MTKFKVGDRVRRIVRPHPAFRIGYEGVVTSVSPDGCVSVDNFRTAYDPFPLSPSCFETIEEKQMATPVLKNMKILIKDEAHSRLVQETLFEMGYMWLIPAGVQYTHMPWLSTYEDGRIYYGQSQGSEFDEHTNEEVELVTTHSFKPIDQEAKRKAAEKEALRKNVAEMQKQLDEMKQKLESM